jgi:hypothetical protein
LSDISARWKTVEVMGYKAACSGLDESYAPEIRLSEGEFMGDDTPKSEGRPEDVLSPGGEDKPKKRAVPTASVTYEVTGAGDITYQARSEAGKATVVKAAGLPWHKTVPVPIGRSPVVGIVLGEQGGQALCALAVQGRPLQSATAGGAFGRATRTGVLPGAPATPDSAETAAG